jgi:O-antigen biosynthesis protein
MQPDQSQIRVSMIMPTRDRPEWSQEALQCFLSQTWTAKELVVVDDEDAPSFKEGLEMENVIYHRLPERLSIGRKRNVCCQLATGQIIQHLDSDDWSGPNRMQDQAQRLIDKPKMMVTGYDQMVFANRETKKAWMYRSGSGCCGTSLTYWRHWWQSNLFKNLEIGEDTAFTGIAARGGALLTVPAGEHMVSWLHNSHTWNRQLKNEGFKPCEYPAWV